MPVPMMPEANSAKANSPGDRTQRLSRLLRALDVGDAVNVQRSRRRQHDEKGDRVREDHADIGVELDPVQVRPGLRRRLAQGLLSRPGALLLHLLRGLPEKQIRADGGAEHRDQGEQVVGIEFYRRNQGAPQHLAPGHMHHERGGDVGEQRQGQPLQDRRVARERNEDLQSQRYHGESDNGELRRSADEQAQRRGHRAEVDGDVDGVGQEQQADHAVQQPGRVMFADVGREPVAGDTADARAHDLDADHQRQREPYRPEHAVAELRAGLRIGRYAARIVIGGTGNQARPEPLQQRDGRRRCGRRAESACVFHELGRW